MKPTLFASLMITASLLAVASPPAQAFIRGGGGGGGVNWKLPPPAQPSPAATAPGFAAPMLVNEASIAAGRIVPPRLPGLPGMRPALPSICHGKLLNWNIGALNALTIREKQGDPVAEYNLGRILLCGDSAPRVSIRADVQKALSWFRKAANQGYRNAELDLGLIYDTGHGVPANPVKAILWLGKAAAAGSGKAQYSLAYNSYYGIGEPPDHAKAVGILKAIRLPSLHKTTAILMLSSNARSYRQLAGIYSTRHHKAAAYWMGRAAELGDGNAEADLGYYYLTGFSLPTNYLAAAYWLDQAMAHGFQGLHYPDEASYDFGAAITMAGAIPNADVIACPWFREPAIHGRQHAQIALARCYYEGSGTPKNVAYAQYWLARAARNSHGYSKLAAKLWFLIAKGQPFSFPHIHPYVLTPPAAPAAVGTGSGFHSFLKSVETPLLKWDSEKASMLAAMTRPGMTAAQQASSLRLVGVYPMLDYGAYQKKGPGAAVTIDLKPDGILSRGIASSGAGGSAWIYHEAGGFLSMRPRGTPPFHDEIYEIWPNDCFHHVRTDSTYCLVAPQRTGAAGTEPTFADRTAHLSPAVTPGRTIPSVPVTAPPSGSLTPKTYAQCLAEFSSISVRALLKATGTTPERQCRRIMAPRINRLSIQGGTAPPSANTAAPQGNAGAPGSVEPGVYTDKKAPVVTIIIMGNGVENREMVLSGVSSSWNYHVKNGYFHDRPDGAASSYPYSSYKISSTGCLFNQRTGEAYCRTAPVPPPAKLSPSAPPSSGSGGGSGGCLFGVVC